MYEISSPYVPLGLIFLISYAVINFYMYKFYAHYILKKILFLKPSFKQNKMNLFISYVSIFLFAYKANAQLKWVTSYINVVQIS